MENSTIDSIVAEQRFEESLRHRTTGQYKRGVHMIRVVKVRQILANIERNLKKTGPYPLDRLRVFMDNCEQYPEVRPLADRVLPKIIEGETVSTKRLAAYNRLRKKMKEFSR